MTNKNIDMCKGPLLKNIVTYTIPIIVTGILQLLFNAADLVIVGQFCNSKCVAAVGSTTSLVTLFVNLFIGISTGTGVTVAHAIGSKDHVDTKRAVHTAIPTAIICGGIISVLGIFLCKPMLQLMDTPTDILPFSVLYLQIYFAGMIFNMLYNFGAAILRAAGDTKSPLMFLTFAGVLNVGLNVIFVTAFNMDVAGVALATTSAQALSAILVLNALRKRTDDCKLSFKEMKIHGRTLKKILAIGIPSGIQSCLFSISNVIVQSSVNSFGTAAVSGVAAATSIEGFTYVVMNSFYQTTINFVGQNDGAKNYKRIKKVFWICLAFVSILGFAMSLLIYIFGHQILSVYITDSSEAIKFGMIKLLYVGMPYFLCGLMEVATGCVRGMGASLIPMLSTVISVCGLRIVWIFTIFNIPGYHTLEVLYLSYPLSWIAAFTCQTLIFVYLYKKRMKALK